MESAKKQTMEDDLFILEVTYSKYLRIMVFMDFAIAFCQRLHSLHSNMAQAPFWREDLLVVPPFGRQSCFLPGHIRLEHLEA